MRMDRYEESTERKRLTGQMQPRGVQTGISTRGMALFGLPFFGVGVWAILAGTKLVPIDPSSLHAPHWMIAMVGVVFVFAGIMLWRMGWRQREASRRRALTLLDGGDPALADYPWNPRGFTPPRWSRVAKTIGAVVFLALFLSMFNWWAFLNRGPLMVKIIVVVFDLILVFVAGYAAMVIGRAFKFGATSVEYARFPFRPGEPAVLRWLVPSGMSRVAKGSFILRCIEEWYESTGSGKNSSRHLMQEQIWAGTWHLDQPQELQPGETEKLDFDLPADAASTSLSTGKTKTVFWELAVDLDLAGLDFKEKYLVPVYRASN